MRSNLAQRSAAAGRRALGIATWVALAAGLAACHEVHFDPHTAAGEIQIYDDLYAVTVPTETHVVAAGYWGAIYRSEDRGDTWQKADAGTTRLVYDVSLADDKRGWAVGQLGMVLRTDDGGESWRPQPNNKEKEGTHLFAVHAVDRDTAWAVGEWGTRIVTDDGGATWRDVSLSIDELHPQFIWLAPVEQDRVRKGEKVYEDVGLNDVFCLRPPSRLCWMVGEFGYIFRSENAGKTWERAAIQGEVSIEPMVLGYNEIELKPAQSKALEDFATQIIDEQHLNIEIEPVATAREVAEFGREDDPSELFDILEARMQSVRAVLEGTGILSDRIRKRGSPPWDYEDFLQDDPGFLKRYLEGRIAEAPGILVRVAQNPYLFSVHFEDENSGFIAGLGGVILQSDDGGRTWAYRRMDRKQAVFSVYPVNGREIAVGEKGLVRVSTDGGTTWREPERGFPNIFTFMRDIEFGPGNRVGFIVGQRGLALRTLDGGETWQQVLPPPAAGAGEDLF